MNQEQEYVYEESIGLEVGKSCRSISCPGCGRHQDFSVTRHEDCIKYNCFRAACPTRGTIELSPLERVNIKDIQQNKFLPKYYGKALYKLTEPMRHLITDTWGLTRAQQIQNGLKWAKDTSRLYLPIYGHLGDRVGGITKIFNKCDLYENEPKSIVYWSDDVPKIDYTSDTLYKTDYKDKKTVIIVEDKLSAIRASAHYPTVSLSGVFLSEDAAIQLSGKYDNLVVALDQDTWHHKTPVGAKIIELYNLYFKSVQSLYIEKDFKDMTEEELKCSLSVL